MVRGAGGTSDGSGEEGLAIGAEGRGERAVNKNFEQRPSFGRSSRVAPGGWPAKAVSKEVALGGNSSDAKASASDSIPLPINEGAVAVPRDILRASDVVGEGDNPGESTSRLPRRDGNPDGEQAMKLEVSESTI